MQKHNVFMMVDVSYQTTQCASPTSEGLTAMQDPAIQKATGETEPVSVMAKLREMKNNFK